jgi:hypothetical protein
VGLIGRAHSRVGCLLHPQAPGNDGHDWRVLSYYGAKACRTYFCPTTRELAAAHQEILRDGLDHWYLYGLAITEHRLWAAFFRALEGRLGGPVTPVDFRNRPVARFGLNAFAALKLDWPFRPDTAAGPCHFFFDDERYARPRVARADPAIPRSPHEEIFRELESRFADGDALRQAEAMLAAIFGDLVAVLAG